MNKQRLQELAGITELGINKPFSKIDILNYMLLVDDYGNSLLDKVEKYDTFEEYLKVWAADEDDNDEDTKYAEMYYKILSAKDLYIFEVEDSNEETHLNLPYPYKHCIYWGLGYNNAKIILHNLS